MKPTPVHPGAQFGRLTVRERGEDHVFPNGKRRARWTCDCECGAEKSVLVSELRNGKVSSCGCYRREWASDSKIIDLSGQKFGRLRVLSRAGHPKSGPNRHVRWHCECECGEYVVAQGSHLKSGHTQSCGCLKVDALIERNGTQGGAARKDPRYGSWRLMQSRCFDVNADQYRYYGARGIIVDDAWLGEGGFLRFCEDMGEKPPTPKEWSSPMPYWTIDRIDPNGNYAPGNCRWATWDMQVANRRTSSR